MKELLSLVNGLRRKGYKEEAAKIWRDFSFGCGVLEGRFRAEDEL